MLEFIAFLLGASLGSFVNVLVIRLMAGEKINGRSHCRSCGKQLSWYHNIPLFSYLFLRGKCAWCRQHISWQYPLVEFSLGLLFTLGTYLRPTDDILWLVTFFVLAVYAVALFVFDARYKVLPDVLTLSGALILFVLSILRGLPVERLVLAALVAAGFFALQYFISKGRWVGSGDIRLGLLMGAALGWPGVVVALIISYWLGALVGLGLMLFKGYGPKSELAFGTYLMLSTVVVYLTGSNLTNWYLQELGLQ